MPELLNQPFLVAKGWPQALVVCQCKKEQGTITLIALTGVNNRTMCENCGKSYYIQGFALLESGPSVVVNFDLPTGSIM